MLTGVKTDKKGSNAHIGHDRHHSINAVTLRSMTRIVDNRKKEYTEKS